MPRPYQQKMIDDIYLSWQSGAKRVFAVLPTGGGKSIVTSTISANADKQKINQVVIAHRVELVSQMSLHIANQNLYHRIIAPKAVVSQVVAEHREAFGKSFINPTANCSVAGIDTLNARADDLRQWAQQIGLWTIDEGHHVLAENKWGKGASLFPNAFGLLVSATPQRADGKGLGSHTDGLADDLVIGPSMRELIDMGALSDYEIVIPESDFVIDDNDIAPSGDFSTKKMAEASKKSHIVGDIVKEYLKYASGKRGITFATDVATANEIAEQFRQEGVPAAAVSSKTPDDVRRDYIRRFRRGDLMQLVNVDLFGEGFDVAAVEVVSMGRPTASLAVFLQQFGRALRLMDGKTHGLVIDHVSNFKRHGLPDKPRFWSLDRRDKKAKKEKDPEEIELTVCRSCSRPYERVLPVCPHCGAAPIITPVDRGNLEKIDGDLMLLDRAKLAELRKATELESPASVAQRVGIAAGPLAGARALNNQIERIQTQQRLSDVIALWAGQQRAMGRDDAQSYRRFYLTLGIDVLSALTLTRAEMENLISKIEGWQK